MGEFVSAWMSRLRTAAVAALGVRSGTGRRGIGVRARHAVGCDFDDHGVTGCDAPLRSERNRWRSFVVKRHREGHERRPVPADPVSITLEPSLEWLVRRAKGTNAEGQVSFDVSTPPDYYSSGGSIEGQEPDDSVTPHRVVRCDPCGEVAVDPSSRLCAIVRSRRSFPVHIRRTSKDRRR